MSFLYDLHLHSAASKDCRTPYRALATMAKRRGLHGLALTDHDTMDGIERVREAWPHEELHLIAGCERTLFDGTHIIGLFLTHNLTAETARDVVAEIHGQGGLVYLPHPFRAYSGLLGTGSEHSESDREWAIEQSDIVEVFNRKCTAEENRLAIELLDRYPKAFAAASDAHYAHEIGWACTEFSAPLSPQYFRSVAAYAPPAALAAELSAFRNGPVSPLRAAARDTLKTLNLLAPAKSLRNYFRRHRQPRWQKYR
jgi:predicted metal-dependent phosphoesterase TrpH